MKHLVIIIPAFNEERGIGGILDGMPKGIESISQIDVIVIDDGSTDRTEQIAREKGVEVITQMLTDNSILKIFLNLSHLS